ncbi:MAG: nucleotidyltransferase family protein [Bacteroidaceae bacterium]|nr:nucleotidyltransferase family protein [Bacteroidaceae bacterium]
MQSLDNNTQAFLALVRAGLWEQDVRLSKFGNIDYTQVLSLAEEQSVVGVVAAGLWQVADVTAPKEDVLQFVGQTLQLEQQNQAMNQFIGVLVERMRKAGIYTLLVKGQGIAQCYEKPLWRACGDVDLFLSDDNYEKAKEFLTPLASSVEKEYVREKHLGMTIDPWVVELHGRLYCGLSSRIEKELDNVYKDTFYGGSVRSWNNDNVQVFMLSVENDAFYVFTHILQHFYKGGIGLRQICDWCRLLWYYQDKLDLRVLEERIKRAGLMTAWKAFGAYSIDYLGMPAEAMPFYSPDIKWKRKADRIGSFIMEVGNFGHNRDKSYFQKHSYVIRKGISFSHRVCDLYHHAQIFPKDSVCFLHSIFINGIKSTIRGE